MINLINAELYRLFKTKAYRNCIIATLIIVILNIFLDGVYLISVTVDGVVHGFRIGLGGNINYIELLRNVMGGSILIYIMGICLTTSITVGRWDSGSLKNIVSYGYKRWEIFLANILSLIIGMAILIIFQFIIVLISTFLIIRPEGIDLILTIKLLISYIVIMGAVISIYGTIASLVQSQSILSILVICEIMFFSMVGHALKESAASFMPILVLRNLATYPVELNFIKIFTCMIILSVVVIEVGKLVFNKLEIK